MPVCNKRIAGDSDPEYFQEKIEWVDRGEGVVLRRLYMNETQVSDYRKIGGCYHRNDLSLWIVSIFIIFKLMQQNFPRTGITRSLFNNSFSGAMVNFLTAMGRHDEQCQ
jgi:hypothetical protein